MSILKNYKADEEEFNIIMSGKALGKAQAIFEPLQLFVKIGVNALN